jgi:hypothetical protein
MDAPEVSSTESSLDLCVGCVGSNAGLIEIYRAGEIDSMVEFLDEMLARLRRDAKARRIRANLEPVLLREVVGLAAPRGTAGR